MGREVLDLSYGGKKWNLSHSRKVPDLYNRDVLSGLGDVIINLPMPNAEGGDIEDGVYSLKLRGGMKLESLLKLIVSVYKEHMVDSISNSVDGKVYVSHLLKVSDGVYDLILM